MKNKCKIFIFLLVGFVLLTNPLSAYSDEQMINIQLKRANNYLRYKKFDKAELIYKNLLKKYPHNDKVVKSFINFYFDTKNIINWKIFWNKRGVI